MPIPDLETARVIAETSLAAYFSLSPKFDLQAKELEIMELFEAPMRLGRPPLKLSRQQIAKVLKRDLGGICGRCNSLVTKGALIERGERVGESGRAQKLLMLPVIEQLDLWQ